MKTQTKRADEVRPGDKVITESGKVVRITGKGPGMPKGTVMLLWDGGWSCPEKNAMITVVTK